MPFALVPGSQTKYPATFQYAGDSDPGPYAIPLTAPIEGGSASSGDRHAIAIDTDNCILYEMWSSYPQASGWSAGSGAIFNLRSDALRTSGWTSADAAGLPVFPGLVRYDEVASGEINHALRFTVPHTQNTFVWPARHFASTLTGYQYPPMGARFRLRADFDISHFSATNQVILTALKKYGMFVADNGSSWFLSGATDSRWNDTDLHALTQIPGSAFEAVDESSLMVDTNSGQTPAAASTPVTVSIDPTSATVMTGSSAQFTATVANATGQGVTWSVNGIAGGNSTVGTVTASGLYVAPSAVPNGGAVTVTATSTDATNVSASATVMIQSPAVQVPTVSSITPNSGTQGTTVTVTLGGANFQSGATATVSGGSGVTVSGLTVVSASQMQGTLVIGGSAPPGTYSVSVSTSAGTSAGVGFTVNPSVTQPSAGAPHLSSLTPGSVRRGTVTTVTISGTNFTAGAAVSLRANRVTVSDVVVVNATTIQARVRVANNAQRGSYALTVATPSGTSNSLGFSVQ